MMFLDTFMKNMVVHINLRCHTGPMEGGGVESSREGVQGGKRIIIIFKTIGWISTELGGDQPLGTDLK